MTDKFRWGVIGPGRIARKFASDLKAVEGFELYAVASRTGAENFVREFDVPVEHSSYQALVDDPQVDGVYIATPHNFHFEQADLCLEAGKPVLCEKPLTVNAQQAASLIERSRKNKVFLMEALWSRYLPIYQAVRKLLDDGVIGMVLAIQSSFCFVANQDPAGRWLNPELAGGTLLDLGVYPIAISQWVIQANPVRVQSQAVLNSTGVDVLIAANLQYPSGAVSQFTSSLIHQARNDLGIHGSKGNIYLQEPFWEAARAILDIDGKETVLHEPFRSQGFEYQIEEAVRCIREGRLESPSMTHADTLSNLQVMDLIREQIGVKYPFE